MTPLVIGYGNGLRRDDGVGLRVAEAVRAGGRVRADVLALHGLTPDVAAVLAERRSVVFVDAVAADPAADVAAQPLEAAPAPPAALSHALDPRVLLRLTELIYGCRPTAWLVTVPAFDLGFGEGLSVAAASRVARAVALVEDLLVTAPG